MHTTKALALGVRNTIVFEGDSLTNRRTPPSLDTWPFAQLMNWHESWADVVTRLLFCWRPELRLTFHNAAVGGSACHDLAARFDSMVRPHKPDWVVATLGGNDAARKIPLAEFRDTLRAYASSVAKANPNACVVWLGGFKPCPHCPPDEKSRFADKARYYRVMRAVAEQTGGAYVDVGAGLQRSAVALFRQHPLHTVYSDGNHYNAVGNTIIAGEVLKAFGVAA